MIRCGGCWGLLGLGKMGIGVWGVWVEFGWYSTVIRQATLIVIHSQFSDRAALIHGPNSPHSAIIAVMSIGSFHSVSHLIDHFNHPFNYSIDTIYRNNLEKNSGTSGNSLFRVSFVLKINVSKSN